MLRTERLRLRAQRRDLEILAALAIVGVVVIQADHTVPSPPSHRPVSTDRLPTRLRGSSAREGRWMPALWGPWCACEWSKRRTGATTMRTIVCPRIATEAEHTRASLGPLGTWGNINGLRTW